MVSLSRRMRKRRKRRAAASVSLAGVSQGSRRAFVLAKCLHACMHAHAFMLREDNNLKY
jgi:hypothetical protein